MKKEIKEKKITKKEQKELVKETESIIESNIDKTEPEPIEEIQGTSNTRVCTCGRTIILPIVGEEPTLCECGVKHTY